MKKMVSFEERTKIFKDTVQKLVLKKKESITSVWEELKKKQKEELKEKMKELSYFESWSDAVREEVAQHSYLKNYTSKDIIKGIDG